MRRFWSLVIISLLTLLCYVASWKVAIIAIVAGVLFQVIVWVIDWVIDSSERWEG